VSQRDKNYYFHRERQVEEIEWVRPTHFKTTTCRGPVVLINGAFDILTAPRMRLIFAARHKAGTLVCALDSDSKIAAEKGAERPILSFAERASCLNYMPIDYIVPIDNKADMTALIKYLQPDLRVQGADYRDKTSRYNIEKMLVREGGLHTTGIVERILDRYAK
jgi:bifunctional ADP-heptose synthase (sugar kinase/adenylyltransferase)